MAEKEKAKIEIELENFQGVLQFDPIIVRAKDMDETHRKILKLALESEITISDVQMMLKIPRSTAYKKLEELVDYRYLKKRYEGANAYYAITEAGKIALAILSSTAETSD